MGQRFVVMAGAERLATGVCAEGITVVTLSRMLTKGKAKIYVAPANAPPAPAPGAVITTAAEELVRALADAARAAAEQAIAAAIEKRLAEFGGES